MLKQHLLSGVTAASLVLVCSACSGHRAELPSRELKPAHQTNSVDGYPSQQNAEAAILTKLNQVGIIGEVVKVGDPVVPRLPEDALSRLHLSQNSDVNNLASTPVTIRVTESLFGQYQPGSRVVLRFLGGSTPAVTTRADQAAAAASFPIGATIAAFGPSPTTYVDGPEMVTPDQVFALEGKAFAPAWYEEAETSRSTTVDELRALTKQRLEFEAQAASSATSTPPGDGRPR